MWPASRVPLVRRPLQCTTGCGSVGVVSTLSTAVHAGEQALGTHAFADRRIKAT